MIILMKSKNISHLFWEKYLNMIEKEECFEPRCKCSNKPDLNLHEGSLLKGMDEFELFLKAQECQNKELSNHCLLRKIKEFIKSKNNQDGK